MGGHVELFDVADKGPGAVTQKLHCDADGCDHTIDADDIGLQWLKVEPVSRSRHVTVHGEIGELHFSSVACLARWASETALRDATR